MLVFALFKQTIRSTKAQEARMVAKRRGGKGTSRRVRQRDARSVEITFPIKNIFKNFQHFYMILITFQKSTDFCIRLI